MWVTTRTVLTTKIFVTDVNAPDGGCVRLTLDSGLFGHLVGTRLTDAHRQGSLPRELARLRHYGLIIVDEVGYLPFELDAANLFLQLVSSRYEYAALILTSNLPFSGWGGVFGDQSVAAAMTDRIVHHADVLTLKSAS